MKSIQYIKFLVITGVIMIASQSINAQSRYFDERYLYTQAHLSPQLINPGAYGSTQQQQILVNYRNKWAGIDGAPTTLTLSYNGPVGNSLAIGINVLSDRFGSLETTKGAFGVSYTIKSPTNQIGFGISAEYIKHGLSGFGNADPLDPLIGLGLAGAEYFDATLGVYGIYMDRFTYGLSLPSVVSSRITELKDAPLDREIGIIVQAGYKVDVQEDITMTPSIILKKLANVPTHLDLNLVFGFLNDKLLAGASYTLGADKRLGFLIGTKMEKLNLFYSYNTSSNLIQDYNSGSHELTLGVNFGGK